MALPIRTSPSFPPSQSASFLSLSEGRENKNHNHRQLIKSITGTTALTNSMKLWAMLCRTTQNGWVSVESSDKTWSTGKGNGQPLQYSSLASPMNSMKRQKYVTLSTPPCSHSYAKNTRPWQLFLWPFSQGYVCREYRGSGNVLLWDREQYSYKCGRYTREAYTWAAPCQLPEVLRDRKNQCQNHAYAACCANNNNALCLMSPGSLIFCQHPRNSNKLACYTYLENRIKFQTFQTLTYS